jgi:hypothetical protein
MGIIFHDNTGMGITPVLMEEGVALNRTTFTTMTAYSPPPLLQRRTLKVEGNLHPAYKVDPIAPGPD